MISNIGKKTGKIMVNMVKKAVSILNVLEEGKDLSLTELTQRLKFPKSSVHSLLETLKMEKFVEKDLITGKFHLGIKLIELGYRAQLELDICKISIPFLHGLNMEFDETVHLTVLDNDEALYVACIESRRRLRTYSVLGYRAPLYCTAVGKAILAFQPEEEIQRIIREKPLRKFTPNTIDTEERLFEDLSRIRKRGYATDDMEHEEHLRCIGVPIRDAHGHVCASLSLSGPAERNTHDRLKAIVPSLIDKGLEISKRLGYRPD
jgi:DNA-binding IclR family transcriptional regulator